MENVGIPSNSEFSSENVLKKKIIHSNFCPVSYNLTLKPVYFKNRGDL